MLPLRDDLHLDHGWSLTEATFAALVGELKGRVPRRLLEFGSGRSTVRLALAFPEAQIVSLEHNPKEFFRTCVLLHRHGVEDRVNLRLAPIRLQRIGAYWARTYSCGPELESIFDAVVIDGPPDHVFGGREAAGRIGFPRLRVGGLLFLDDFGRRSEQLAAEHWRKTMRGPWNQRVLQAGAKKLLVVEKTTEMAAAFAWGVATRDLLTATNQAFGALVKRRRKLP